METFKSLFRMIVRLVIVNIVLILFFASAPLLYTVVPFWYFLATPHRNPADMFTIYMLTSPFACGFWMTIVCHWQTVRRAQREGRLAHWRDTEGGMFCTVGKSIGFMVMGWFGSALAEVVFCFVFQSLLATPAGRLEFFAIAPFAAFAPVWIVLLRRWQRSRKNEDFIRRVKNDRDQLRAASLHAKNLRSTPTDHGSHYELC